jgi:hypothetical protein
MSKNSWKTNRESKENQAHPSPLRDCVAMKEKGRHARESGNPGNLKKNKFLEITRYFSMSGLAWMPASAGMTNYDTVAKGRGG